MRKLLLVCFVPVLLFCSACGISQSDYDAAVSAAYEDGQEDGYDEVIPMDMMMERLPDIATDFPMVRQKAWPMAIPMGMRTDTQKHLESKTPCILRFLGQNTIGVGAPI